MSGFLMCQKTSFFECVKILWIFNVSTFGRIIKETGGLRSAVCGLRFVGAMQHALHA